MDQKYTQGLNRPLLDTGTYLYSSSGSTNKDGMATISEVCDSTDGSLPGESLQTPDKRTRKEVRTSFWEFTLAWKFEILASVASLGTMAAMVAALQYFNGRSIYDLGLPSGLTPNSLIATLATLGRIFAMYPISSVISQGAWIWFSGSKARRLTDLEKFEAASRSPGGSLRFLLTSPKG